MPSLPIMTPARFAAASAMGYADPTGALSLVSAATPLPVAPGPAAVPAPLAGTAAASTAVGGFAPARGVPVVLVLRGIWQGSARVLRSTDGGTTLDPLTLGGSDWGLFSGNACEAVWEENDPAATLHLAITLASGTITYRLGH